MDRTVYIPQSTNSYFLDAEASQLRDPVTFTRDDHNACKLRKNPSFVLRRLDHDSGVLLAACCGAQLRKRPRKDDLRICGSHSLPILIQSPSKSLSKSPLGTQLGSKPTICGMEENRAVLDHPTRMSVRSHPYQQPNEEANEEARYEPKRKHANHLRYGEESYDAGPSDAHVSAQSPLPDLVLSGGDDDVGLYPKAPKLCGVQRHTLQ
jgi:hypothetical protein